MSTVHKKIEYTEGSNNIYEDIGLSQSEERLAKAKLAMRIEAIIEKRGLKQIEAGKILGINQPKISALMNGNLSGFSMERLIHFLTLLNQDIEIIVKSNSSRSTRLGRVKIAFG